MASLASTYKEIARISSRHFRRYGDSRNYRSSARVLAAQNFTMPAMSPTMTEGNIASWKVKDGDSFSAGDVLLEIETDKAQMDVEAQDDGIMAKITQGDGAKSVKVGTRIAVLAEPGDDLSSISVSAEDSTPVPSQETANAGENPSQSSESQAQLSSLSRSTSASQDSSSPRKPSPKQTSSKQPSQAYPLYPSVSQLLHEKGVPSSEIEKIPASGPKGRLLKGDVLAYLGTIQSTYSSDQSTRISRLGHLDFSQVKIAPPKSMSSTAKVPEAPTPIPEPETDTEVAVSISFKAVLEVQKRTQDTLGVTLPLSVFIARATEVANDDLPRSKLSASSSEELFNQVLGLDKLVPSTKRGSFVPQITALPSASLSTPQKMVKKPDIIDILAGKSSSKNSNSIRPPPAGVMAGSSPNGATNVFSVSVKQGEEKRARVFLERVKTILQVEPGRLVL